MPERRKIGVRVDAELWERFRNDVQERKGQTRGVLGDEVEKALRQYTGDESQLTEEKIDARLQRIEAAVVSVGTDGGTDTLTTDEHTHAPSRLDVDGKPSANAATEKKVAYLAECVLDEFDGEFQAVDRGTLIDTVKEEYGFRSDTAKRYVQRLIDHFGLRKHPIASNVFVTPERYEELAEQQREQAREEAEEKL